MKKSIQKKIKIKLFQIGKDGEKNSFVSTNILKSSKKKCESTLYSRAKKLSPVVDQFVMPGISWLALHNIRFWCLIRQRYGG